jgi:hypothetical protein
MQPRLHALNEAGECSPSGENERKQIFVARYRNTWATHECSPFDTSQLVNSV